MRPTKHDNEIILIFKIEWGMKHDFEIILNSRIERRTTKHDNEIILNLE